MKKNVGNIDKVFRILIALVIIVLFFMHAITGPMAVILLILSAILILTSLISFCPLYWPFGISTNKKKV
jgi:hypothetical protein